MQWLFRQDSMHGCFGRPRQRRETGLPGVLPDMPCQSLPTPNFGRVTQILRFRARQMYHPRFGIGADCWFLGTVIAIFQRRHRTHRQGLCHPFRNAQARHPKTSPHAGDALSPVIPKNDGGALRLPMR